ncbi:calcineurin-like phosphoesterase family protein [Anseongella ginsenosidimutans]|uniref:Calcineurin-like phosphoesterase family protein n=1 Tax=Anseongella ginsenosidimutans TaxID=496056 RepID=A0A4R3KYH4_9SPHI|nr:metallophosphoesterase [Anseongella ginsenosidimutans]QEC50994.1 phosphatase [Anseongella ginsenosidimutans]TCS90354.1 calcineurin-like phosphoesterase family protein [Anseongella ginsenosidimutans]
MIRSRKLTFLLFAVVFTFTGIKPGLAQQSEPLFTFGVMTDVQYANQDNAGTRHYRSSPGKLREAVAVFNREKVAFVLHLGDFIDKGFRHFDTLNAITGKLQMPLYHVLGNHDFSVKAAERSKVLPKMGLRKAYYSFSKKKWRFIILNGNDVSLFANAPGSEKYMRAKAMLEKLKEEGAPNARDWNGAVGGQQIKWLQKELALAERRGEQVIVACHYPLYPNGASELLWNAARLRELAEASPQVVAWFNGHVHKSQYFPKNGVHYISFRGIVEEEENACAVVSVFDDRLEIKGFGSEQSRTLTK